MPRKDAGERGESWEISTRPDIIHEVYKSRHEKMTKLIKKSYFEMDVIYEKVAEILDRNGIHTTVRPIYRNYSEELYRLVSRFSGSTLEKEATALTLKYSYYGCDEQILKEISSLFGISVKTLSDFVIYKEIRTEIPTPYGVYYDYEISTEYNESTLSVSISYEVEVV